ncbi:hypothetical protein [Frondihabitans sp. PAMC 28766]|uniref:hypothetical protein n=1 Tax=Frondihabitans sp. PAMC 28766 TaxID=1795630 RepID=UPI0012FF962E|nr:hypothetical protein [Frondihabitans sp. PAMC 28766]
MVISTAAVALMAGVWAAAKWLDTRDERQPLGLARPLLWVASVFCVPVTATLVAASSASALAMLIIEANIVLILVFVFGVAAALNRKASRPHHVRGRDTGAAVALAAGSVGSILITAFFPVMGAIALIAFLGGCLVAFVTRFTTAGD